MRRLLALCMMIAAGCVLMAQPVSQFAADYYPAVCTGDMPADFARYGGTKVKTNEAAYHALFTSGELLFGTPMNAYVEAVAERLLESWPELRGQLRFYILRSPEVNAAAYENGMVVVNTGLLAQLQNESELAFILAHEIVHIQEGHIQAEREAAKKERRATRQSLPDVLVTSQYRSREHETEADRLAFQRFFAQTAYSYEALDGVFDVLQYSYLPFDEIPFDRRFVEAACYHFPDDYFLAAVTPVRAREDYADTLSSHPNLLKRREWIRRQVAVADNSGRSTFLQPEALFREMRDRARFECIDSWLTQHKYTDAFYNSYVMLRQYPENLFLHRALYMSLYGVACQKNSDGFDEAVPPSKEVEGEKQQVCHFLRKARLAELELLALRFAWQAHLRNPQDAFAVEVVDHIMRQLTEDNLLVYAKFSDYPMDWIPSPVEQAERQNETAVAGSKYDRLKQGSATRSKVMPAENFTTRNFMLADLRQNPAFWNHVDSVKGVMEDEASLKALNTLRNAELRKPMMVWNPLYFKLKLGGRNYLPQGDKLEKTILKSCKRLKINLCNMDKDSLMLASAESYNHYCKLQRWHTDYLNAAGNTMALYQSCGIGEACAAAGSDHFCVAYAYSHPEHFIFRYMWLPFISAVLVPLASPVAAAHFFAFDYETKAQFAVIDVKTSKILYSSSLDADAEQTDAYLHDFIYQSLHDVKYMGK